MATKKPSSSKTSVFEPIKVTKTALEEDSTATINGAFQKVSTRFDSVMDGVSKTCHLVEQMKVQLMASRKELSQRITNLEQNQTDYTVSGELGTRLGKVSGGLATGVFQPITGTHVLMQAVGNCWEAFKTGFTRGQEDYRRVAQERAKAQAAKDAEQVTANFNRGGPPEAIHETEFAN